jgi:hypothetical protein
MVKNYTIEILMGKVTPQDIGVYDLTFIVSDMYTFTEYVFSIELTDLTPMAEAPPVPELPPGFISPIETIQVNYTVNSTNPSVSYILPESFDYNFDSYSITFNQTFWAAWAHILTYDGISVVTVTPDNLLPEEVEVLKESPLIEQVINMVDAKGYEAKPVILPININVV